jgi:DNA modification methylase
MQPYYERGDIRIYHGDSREIAPQLPASDLVVTSPPYADQRRYGFKKGEFRWDHVVPRALAGVNLAPDGQMLVNLGLVHRDGEVVCYWEPLIHTLRSFGYRLFGWYPWDQGDGLPGDWHGRLAPSHEWVFHFNRDSKRPNKTIACKHAGAKSTSIGLMAGGWSFASTLVAECKIPDSVIRVTRHKGANEGGHPAPYPVAFADFMMRAWDGTVLDPFMGGGTTLLAAYRLHRPAIGIEIDESYCEIAAKRLEKDVLPLEATA